MAKALFIDVKKASNDTHFLIITSSEKFDEDKYHRRTIQLWEEDLGFFVEALSMVLLQLAYGELSPPEVKIEVVKDPKGMKAIAEYERPREKLQALGADKLSHAELLAIYWARVHRSFRCWIFVRRSCGLLRMIRPN
jgi:hypothetical protein